MNGVDFRKPHTLYEANSRKEELSKSLAKNLQAISLLPKLELLKIAIEGSPTETALKQLRGMKDLDKTLGIGAEVLSLENPEHKKDAYNLGIRDKTELIVEEAIEHQSQTMHHITQSIEAYNTLLDLYEEELVFAKPITDIKIKNALNKGRANFPSIKYSDYIHRVEPFRNRLSYILTFINPKFSLENVNVSDFITGMPYYSLLAHNKSSKVLDIQGIQSKERSKLSSMGWVADNLLEAYEDYIKTDKNICTFMNKVSDNIHLHIIKQDKNTIGKSVVLFASMMDLVDDYLHTQKAFMSMFFNLLKQ